MDGQLKKLLKSFILLKVLAKTEGQPLSQSNFFDNNHIAHRWMTAAYGDTPHPEDVEYYSEALGNRGHDQWELKEIPLSAIDTHHSGHDASEEYIKDYSDRAQKGSKFPPIIIEQHPQWNDHPAFKGRYRTIDGQHRVKAANAIGHTHIMAYVPVHPELKKSQLQKASYNVRAQRKKVFGAASQPSAGSAMREKHIGHIQKFVKDFLNLDLEPSGGKIDPKTGQRRDESPKVGIDKPDWRSGQFESQWNPEAIIHEIAHLMLLPKGMGLKAGQAWMDRNFAESNKLYGWQQGKYTQNEVQPMAAEQLIRRMMGLPASQVSVPVKSPDDPPRMAVDQPDMVIGTRVKQGKTRSGDDKWVDLIRQSRFLTPENKQRLEDVFTKKIVFHPVHGWVDSNSLHAKIYHRAKKRLEEPVAHTIPTTQTKLAASEKDVIPGGKADRKLPSDFDQKQLRMGIKVELEHTDDPKIAQEIAMDHLSEDPEYYTKLKTIHVEKSEDLEKEEAPVRPGQVSSHGQYIADYHPNGNLVWHYHPDIARKTDDFIKQNKDKYLKKIKPEYQQVVSSMFDHVLSDRNRHVVAAFDSRQGPPSIRARHLKSLIEGHGHVKLKGHGPNDISLVAIRHGLGSNYNEQHIMPFSNKNKLAASELYKSEIKRYLEEKGYFQSEDLEKKKKTRRYDPGRPLPKTHGHHTIPLKEKGLAGLDWHLENLWETPGSPGGYRTIKDIPREEHEKLHAERRKKLAASENEIKKDWRQSYELHKEVKQPTVIYHYSRQPGLKAIDPKRMGTGTPGSFSRRFNPSQIKDFPHTSFHYVKDEPEDIVRSGSMAKYTLTLDPQKHPLYDLSTDKKGLVRQAIEENQGAWNYENVLKKIKEAGYHGTWASQSDNPVIGNTVQLFHEHPVDKEEGV